MLVIKEQQFKVFEQMLDKNLESRIIAHLRSNHEVLVDRLPEDLLREMVRNGIMRARKYSLSWESSLTAFVALMFEIAPNFDDHPDIQRVLKDKTVEPDQRIDLLSALVSEEDWQEAVKNYDESAWFPEN